MPACQRRPSCHPCAAAALPPLQADSRSGRVAEAIEKQRGKPIYFASGGGSGGDGGAGGTSPLLVQAVLNPLSKAAQQLAPVRGSALGLARRDWVVRTAF